MRDHIQRVRSSPLAGRITRYSLGSAVALLTSIVTFASLNAAGVGTTMCSVLAFAAGTVPSWILNRRWTWQVQGRVSVLREVVGYLVISLLALTASSLATGYAQSHATASPGVRVVLVTATYVAVQAALFAVKFVAYERWVFVGHSRVRTALRSRIAVWTTARANRMP